MIDEGRKRAREVLLAQLEDLYRKLAENQKRIRELESTLPLEEQVRLGLERVLIKSEFPGKVRVEIVRPRTKLRERMAIPNDFSSLRVFLPGVVRIQVDQYTLRLRFRLSEW